MVLHGERKGVGFKMRWRARSRSDKDMYATAMCSHFILCTKKKNGRLLFFK